MKKLVLFIGLLLLPFLSSAQNYFDSLEENDMVTSLIVNKNVFKLMTNLEIDSDDPKAKEYFNLISNLENLKVFVTEDAKTAAKMNNMMGQYLKKSKLEELMRIKDGGTNVKFYVKKGNSETKVKELLMFVTDTDMKLNGGKIETVLLSLTGNIDLKQISKLTEEMHIPGGKHLEKVEKQ